MVYVSTFKMTDGACPSADKGDRTNTISLVGKPYKNGTICTRSFLVYFILSTPLPPKGVPL